MKFEEYKQYLHNYLKSHYYTLKELQRKRYAIAKMSFANMYPVLLAMLSMLDFALAYMIGDLFSIYCIIFIINGVIAGLEAFVKQYALTHR